MKIHSKYADRLKLSRDKFEDVVCVACIENKCCPLEPVVIVRHRFGDTYAFEAMCSCGNYAFRTDMVPTLVEAFMEYEELNREYDEYVKEQAETRSLGTISFNGFVRGELVDGLSEVLLDDMRESDKRSKGES